MTRESLKQEYDNVQNSIYELQYLLILMKYILDSFDKDEVSDEEVELLYLELNSILVNYHYDKGRLFGFRKKINSIIEEYKIDISLLDNKYFEELPFNISDYINNLNKK
jgi:hypothetical protein